MHSAGGQSVIVRYASAWTEVVPTDVLEGPTHSDMANMRACVG